MTGLVNGQPTGVNATFVRPCCSIRFGVGGGGGDLRTAAIPKELVETAQMDGCSLISAFLCIVVPIAKPGIVTAGIFSFLFGWGDLVFALSLTDDDSVRPITAGLWAFFGANTSDWPGAMAFSTLAMLPPLMMFLFTQRHVVAGLTAGA